MNAVRIIALLALVAVSRASIPSKACQFDGEYLRDIYDNCFFFRCVGLSPIKFRCAPGTGVPVNYVDNGNGGSPCSEIIGLCGIQSATITPIPTTTAAPITAAPTTTAAPATTTTAAPATTTTVAPATTTTAAPATTTTAAPATTTAGGATTTMSATTAATTAASGTTTTTAAPATTTTAAPATVTTTAAATTSTTTTVGPTIPDTGCPAPFLRTDNANMAGGSLIANINTIETCKQQCLIMADCMAIDFNTGLSQCYMHTDATLGILNMNVQNVIHFRKTACAQNAGLPSGYLSVSSGYHVLSGTKQSGTFTLDACLTSCTSSSTCLAVDYNAEGSCWHHTNVTSCNALVSKAFCQHYKRIECFSGSPAIGPAVPSGYTSFITGYHIFGATPLSGLYSLSGCLAACSADGSCLAVDYNAGQGTCWPHTLTTSCNTLYQKDLCAHYKKVSCTTRQFIPGYGEI